VFLPEKPIVLIVRLKIRYNRVKAQLGWELLFKGKNTR